MRSQIQGQLTEITFTQGQTVKAGDLLAQIDPRPYQAQLDQITANRDRDQAQLANAIANLGRYTALKNKGYATPQLSDTQKAQVAQLQAAIKADEALIEQAEVQLGYTRLTSPIPGVTGVRQIDVGNVIHPTDPNGLVVVTQVEPISLIFAFPQAELPRSLISVRRRCTSVFYLAGLAAFLVLLHSRPPPAVAHRLPPPPPRGTGGSGMRLFVTGGSPSLPSPAPPRPRRHRAARAPAPSPRNWPATRPDPTACSLLTDRIDETLLRACPHLIAVSNLSRYENIDVAAATARGPACRPHPGRADRRDSRVHPVPDPCRAAAAAGGQRRGAWR